VRNRRDGDDAGYLPMVALACSDHLPAPLDALIYLLLNERRASFRDRSGRWAEMRFAALETPPFVKELYRSCKNVLFSGQRGSHAQAHNQRDGCNAGYQAVVPVACADHLPATPSARAAYPHST
jgi:hypothetical protein